MAIDDRVRKNLPFLSALCTRVSRVLNSRMLFSILLVLPGAALSQAFDWKVAGSNTNAFFNGVKNHPFIGRSEAPGNIEREHEDIEYELKHRNTEWYRSMNEPNADYFHVKHLYEEYFAEHKWEKSKPRAIGEVWLETNIFFLDKNGRVQERPPFDYSKNVLHTTDSPTGATTRDVGTWHMLGPVNSIHVGGPIGNHGGYVYLNRIDPTDPQKMFVSFLTGGLWMTSDGGTSWTLVDANLPDGQYIDLDVCISNPSVVYAISSDASVLIKSTDGGFSWSATTMIAANFPGRRFYDIAVSPSDPNVVIARIGNSIYRTADGGTTWTSIVTGLPAYSVWDCSNLSEMVDWSTTDNNVVYFLTFTSGNQFSVYRSADAGLSFSIINTTTLDPAANGQVIGWAKLLLPSDNATAIYVAIGNGTDPYQHRSVQLYKLDNTTGAEISKRVNMLQPPGSPLHHGDLAMDRTNENRLVYGTYGTGTTHYSTDNGATFSPSTTDIHFDIRSVDMVNNRVLTGNDGATVLSTDGGITHVTLTNSISNHELWGFGSAFKSELVATGNNHGPHMIREAGAGYEWYSANDADAGNIDVNPLDDRYLYAGPGYFQHRYFRTGPATFQDQPLGLILGNFHYFNNIEFHPNLYYTIITHSGGGNDLRVSHDNGSTASTVHTFPAQVARNKIYFQNPNIMYVLAGTSNGKIWKTTDGGTTWADVTPSSLESSGQVNISDIALSDVDPNVVWISYSSVQTACKVLKTTNGGTSWSPVGTPATLTSNPIARMVYQRGSDGGIYVGTISSGVFYKNNTMPDWVMIGNLPALQVRNMFINYNLGKLRIGTSRGAWEHDLYETSPPMAQISANSNKFSCGTGNNIQFRDYSTVRNASATWAWSFPGGSPATSNQENPVVSYSNAPNGNYSVSLTVTDAYGTSSQTLTDFVEVNSASTTFPIVEDFQNTFPPASLVLGTTNPGVNFTQDVTVGGFSASGKSASFKNWENAHRGTTVEMTTLPFTIPSGPDASFFAFDVAYSHYFFDPDTLVVLVSANCGESFTELYRKDGLTLSTNGGINLFSMPFVPTATQWRRDSIEVTAYNGQNVIFKFRHIVKSGNNLYLDNLNVLQNVSAPFTAVILATNSIYLQEKSKILSGDVIVNNASPGPTLNSGVELSVGEKVTTPSGYALQANRIKVKEKATIGGNVYYNTLSNKGKINGSLNTPLSLPVVANLPPFHQDAAGSVDKTVSEKKTLTLAAGNYKDVTVKEKGTLILTGGVYNLRNLNAKGQANIFFTAASEVRIANKLAAGEKSTIGPHSSSGIGAADIVFYINGVNGVGGGLGENPKAAALGAKCKALANFYVPNGTLSIGEKSAVTGAFIARDMIIGEEAGVAKASAFSASLTKPEVTAEQFAAPEIPEQFGLMQNYPNPFNPSTTIRYALPTDARVTLTVYDVLGRRVAELVNGYVAAGYHNAQFIASNLASGMYIYRLNAQASDGNNFTQTRKLMLMK